VIVSVRFLSHEGKPEAKKAEGKMAAWLRERSVDVVERGHADLIVSLGGDGTMLRAANLANSCDALLLGINLGHLGYLTEADSEHDVASLQRVLSGDFHIEERLMLSCEASDGDERATFVGLNEVLIERPTTHRMVRLAVAIGDEPLTTYYGDGVLVATPTGSTAYALSAGGPIVSPRAECLVLVPVSPHRFFARPVVLADDESVTITVEEQMGEANLSLDGTPKMDLHVGASVKISAAEKRLKLVRLSGPGFLARLRVKLDLPD
jgi:NAD+ kinase